MSADADADADAGGEREPEREDRSVNVTDGALVRPLVVLSAPIVLSMLLQVGYNVADTFWVGRLGQEAVAALSFSWPPIFLMISVAGGFTVAGTVLVAQNKGAGRDARVDHVAGQTIGFVALLAATFSVAGWLLAPTLLSAIGARGAELELSIGYTRIVFLGVSFLFGFFVFQSLLRGWGDTRTPLYLMAFGVGLNVVLDPFLILGFQGNVLFDYVAGPLAAVGLDGAAAAVRGLQPALYDLTGFAGMGVEGAAVATVVSRGIGATLGIYWLLSGAVGIQPALADFRPRLETVREIVRIGAPASVEQSMNALGVVALTALVALVGDDAVAALGIGNRLVSLVFLPAMGLAQGTETVVGQNLGARQAARARRAVLTSVAIVAGVMVPVTAVGYLFAPAIVGAFITGEGSAAVVAVGTEYLRIVAVSFVALGAFQVLQGGFRGSGATRTAMVLSIGWLWLLRVPIAAVLVVAAGWGATGVWTAIAVANGVICLLAGAHFLRSTWDGGVVHGADADAEEPADTGECTARPAADD